MIIGYDPSCTSASATSREPRPWWAVDFGSSLSIGMVNITTPKDKCDTGKTVIFHLSPILFAVLFSYLSSLFIIFLLEVAFNVDCFQLLLIF